MSQKTFTIANFARTYNVDPKKMRGRLRRAFRANAKNVPFVVNDENARVAHTHNDAWTFNVRDEQRVARIAMNDVEYARYMSQRAKNATTDA
jgi:hypothetical protein